MAASVEIGGMDSSLGTGKVNIIESPVDCEVRDKLDSDALEMELNSTDWTNECTELNVTLVSVVCGGAEDSEIESVKLDGPASSPVEVVMRLIVLISVTVPESDEVVCNSLEAESASDGKGDGDVLSDLKPVEENEYDNPVDNSGDNDDDREVSFPTVLILRRKTSVERLGSSLGKTAST